MPFSIAEFPTIPRYYTALAQWMNCMAFVLVFRGHRRVHGLRLALICLLGLMALTAELMLTDSFSGIFWVLGMAAAAALMLLLMLACLKIPPMQAAYQLTSAFMWSELAASLAWQVYYYYASWFIGFYHELAAPLVVSIVYVVQFLITWKINEWLCPDGKLRVLQRSDLYIAAVVSISFFCVSNLSFLFPNTPFTSSYATEIFNIRTLVDLGAVAILHAAFFQRQEMHTRYELETIQNVLQSQYDQYLLSRDSLELINRKCHDIKHQINAIRAEMDPQRRALWLDSIEKDVAFYDSRFQTGNAVLDTILSGKSILCQEKNLRMTCVADGTLLSFLEAMDICSVFGNALDNAIESVEKVPDPERRLIHVSVSREKGFLLIRVENYYEGIRDFEDGIPRSTKGDDNYHGFGVKSIRYTAHKYGGEMSISALDHWFDLKVMIPLPSQV